MRAHQRVPTGMSEERKPFVRPPTTAVRQASWKGISCNSVIEYNVGHGENTMLEARLSSPECLGPVGIRRERTGWACERFSLAIIFLVLYLM